MKNSFQLEALPAMAMRRCPSCDARIDDRKLVVCPECGEFLPRRISKWRIVVGSTMTILILIAAYAAYRDPKLLFDPSFMTGAVVLTLITVFLLRHVLADDDSK